MKVDKMEYHYKKVIEDFGDEWTRFDQQRLSEEELHGQYDRYFKSKNFDELKKKDSLVIIDVGAGSGRWIRPLLHDLKVKRLIAIEPSKASDLLKKKFSGDKRVEVVNNDLETLKVDKYARTADLIYCLGVLHHTSSISENFKKLIEMLKTDGTLICYLYYKLDFRPLWYKAIWRLSNIPRYFISRSPSIIKNLACDLIAACVYLPIVSVGRMFPENKQKYIPLYGYFDRSFYSMRTDARDRFGTREEKRVSKKEIIKMCEDCGIENLIISDRHPFWVFSGKKK